jgi:Carbohydrate family 9 binding domain-like
VFIGSDFHDIKRYKEFEVSPQNEWVDLDINLSAPRHEDGWLWNSGFEHSARIDRSGHIWYAAMRIPLAALGTPAPAEGAAFRVNLFRTEGPADDAKEITWRPPMSNTFHAPQRFGLLRLVTH